MNKSIVCIAWRFHRVIDLKWSECTLHSDTCSSLDRVIVNVTDGELADRDETISRSTTNSRQKESSWSDAYFANDNRSNSSHWRKWRSKEKEIGEGDWWNIFLTKSSRLNRSDWMRRKLGAEMILKISSSENATRQRISMINDQRANKGK